MPRPLSQSRRIRLVAAGLSAAGVALAVACSEAPTAPAPTQAFIPGPHLSRATGGVVVGALTLPTTTLRDSSLTFTVLPGGSTLEAPGGLATVRFPAGFVARPTQFTITRKAGPIVGYDFQPSGTFTTPVTVTINVGPAAAALGGLQGVYVSDWAQLNPLSGKVAADEFVPTTVDRAAGTVTLTLSHFSGYLVSTGRR